MSTTATAAFGAATTTSTTGERPSFWRRLYRGIIASREAQARRVIAGHFALMSDQRLADLGLTPEHIGHIRKSGRLPVSYWS